MNIFDSWLVQKRIAHRGLFEEGKPENSLAAFENAIANNYAIELDVRALKDGTIVVFHDDKLGRMTGLDGYISNCTYEDIKDARLLKTDECIPTLEQVLALVNGRTELLIEIKNMNKVGFEKDVYKILSTYKGEWAVESFNPYSLEWFKHNAPHIKRGQLSSFFKGENLGCMKKFALKRMLLNNKISEPNFICYNLKDLPNRFVKKYSELPLIAWCVHTPEDIEKAKKVADNYIFDNVRPKS